MKRINERPESAPTLSGLNKCNTSKNIIPIRITYQISQRTFAEANAEISIFNLYDFDTGKMLKGDELTNFLHQISFELTEVVVRV